MNETEQYMLHTIKDKFKKHKVNFDDAFQRDISIIGQINQSQSLAQMTLSQEQDDEKLIAIAGTIRGFSSLRQRMLKEYKPKHPKVDLPYLLRI